MFRILFWHLFSHFVGVSEFPMAVERQENVVRNVAHLGPSTYHAFRPKLKTLRLEYLEKMLRMSGILYERICQDMPGTESFLPSWFSWEKDHVKEMIVLEVSSSMIIAEKKHRNIIMLGSTVIQQMHVQRGMHADWEGVIAVMWCLRIAVESIDRFESLLQFLGTTCHLRHLLSFIFVTQIVIQRNLWFSGITKEPPMIGTKIGIWVKLRCRLGDFLEAWKTWSFLVKKFSGPAFTKRVPWFKPWSCEIKNFTPVEEFPNEDCEIWGYKFKFLQEAYREEWFLGQSFSWCHPEPNKSMLPENYTTFLDKGKRSTSSFGHLLGTQVLNSLEELT